MLPRLPILLAAGALLCSATPAAAHHVRYRADLDVSGTWTESVRAGTDDADADGDGREEVAQRDQEMRFTLRSSIPSVTFHKGRVRGRARSVEHDLSLEIVRSTLTEPEGESGSCSVFEPGAGGAAELLDTNGGLVFRPAGDVIFQASCKTPTIEFPFHMNAQQELALDAAFALPKLGAERLEFPVAKPNAAPCPVEDPGHTLACSFDWSGTVVLRRLADAVKIGRPRVKGRYVLVPIATPRGTRIKRLRRPRGTRLTVRDGDLRRTFRL